MGKITKEQYSKRVLFLEKIVTEYYMANFRAQEAIRGDGELVGSSVCGLATMEGEEEIITVHDAKGLKAIINNLPLNDCGIGLTFW